MATDPRLVHLSLGDKRLNRLEGKILCDQMFPHPLLLCLHIMLLCGGAMGDGRGREGGARDIWEESWIDGLRGGAREGAGLDGTPQSTWP